MVANHMNENTLSRFIFVLELINYFSIDIKDPTFKVISVLDLCISTFFVLEVAMRMYAMTPTWYFSKRYWFNTLDFVIVVIGFVGSLIEIVLIYTKCAKGNVRTRKTKSFKT